MSYQGPEDLIRRRVATPPVRVGKTFEPAARVGQGNVVCLHPDCVEALAAAIERRLVTSKGITVKLSSSCQQPFSARDLDAIVTNITLPNVPGERVLVVATKANGERQMVKGIGIVATLTGSTPFDPFSFCRFAAVRNGQPINPYNDIRAPISQGISGLSACTIDLRDGDLLELYAQCVQVAPATILVSGRLKGWAYVPTADGDRVDGAMAF